MINPTIDTLLVILCVGVLVLVWLYAHMVHTISGKSRYIMTLGWANIALLNGITWLDLMEQTTLTFALSVVIGALLVHGISMAIMTLANIAAYLDEHDWYGKIEQLAIKRHGRKDK